MKNVCSSFVCVYFSRTCTVLSFRSSSLVLPSLSTVFLGATHGISDPDFQQLRGPRGGSPPHVALSVSMGMKILSPDPCHHSQTRMDVLVHIHCRTLVAKPSTCAQEWLLAGSQNVRTSSEPCWHGDTLCPAGRRQDWGHKETQLLSSSFPAQK